MTLFFIKTTQGAGKEQISTKDDFFLGALTVYGWLVTATGMGPGAMD